VSRVYWPSEHSLGKLKGGLDSQMLD